MIKAFFAVLKLFTCKHCCHTTTLLFIPLYFSSLSMTSIIEHFDDIQGNGATIRAWSVKSIYTSSRQVTGLTSVRNRKFPFPTRFPVVFEIFVLIGATIFQVSNMRRGRYFTWSSEPREGLACYGAKGVPSLLSYFKTLSIDPDPEPATSRFAINTFYRVS